MAKRKKRNGVHVHVHLPKQYVGAAGREAGRVLGGKVAGWLITNPIAAVIIIVVGIAAFLILGGITLAAVFTKFMNVWMWALAILIAVLTKPKDTIIMWAILLGFVFWMYAVYQEMLAWQQLCQIPIIGWIACFGKDILTFLPKMWDLGVTVFVAFAMIYICEFIRYQIEKR